MFCGLRGTMTFTYIPTQSGFMRLEDSKKLLRAIFPNWPNLEPCRPAPHVERVAASAGRSN
jgi:hypothetical protein